MGRLEIDRYADAYRTNPALAPRQKRGGTRRNA